jgi:hypothetical protein
MRLGNLSRHLHTDDFRSAKPAPSHTERLAKGALHGAAIGSAAGAVIGAGAGYVQGLTNARTPVGEVRDEVFFSQRPELIGASYDDEDTSMSYNSTTESWETETDDDDWDAIVRHHNDKEYRKPGFRLEKPGVVGSVLTGALKGAAIGGVVGAVGVTAARAAGWSGLSSKILVEEPGKAMLLGGAAGVIIGGVAGYHAGQVAHQNALVEVRTAPIYETQQIGWMPTEWNADDIARDLDKGWGDYDIYYKDLPSKYGDVPFQGQDPVYGRVQVGEGPKEYRSTFMTPLTGTLVGVAAGGLLGVAVGAAASVLNRLVEE